MAPASPNTPNPNSSATSSNPSTEGSYMSRFRRIRGDTKTVKDLGYTEKKFSSDTPIFSTLNHGRVNAGFSHNSTQSLHLELVTTHNNSYIATTMQNCNGTCVSVAIVISLVLFFLSFGLFISLFSRCGRTINGRWRNITRRRIDSQLVLGVASTTRSIEPPPLPPYGENAPPAYSEFTVIHELPTINSANVNPSSQVSSRTSDQTSIVLTESATYTSTTSSETSEMTVPLAPLIPTIQLPPVGNDTLHDFERTDEVEALHIDDAGLPNDRLKSNCNPEVVGSLELIFE